MGSFTFGIRLCFHRPAHAQCKLSLSFTLVCQLGTFSSLSMFSGNQIPPPPSVWLLGYFRIEFWCQLIKAKRILNKNKMHPWLVFVCFLLEVSFMLLVWLGWELVQVMLSVFMDPLPVVLWYLVFATALLVSVGIDVLQIYAAHCEDASRCLPSYLVRFGTNCLVYFLVLTPLAIRYGLNAHTFTAEQMKAFMDGSPTGQKVWDRIFSDIMNIAVGRVVVTGIEVIIAAFAALLP